MPGYFSFRHFKQKIGKNFIEMQKLAAPLAFGNLVCRGTPIGYDILVALDPYEIRKSSDLPAILQENYLELPKRLLL